MAKTRRHKINRSPGTPFGRHCRAAVVEQGSQMKTTGARKEITETKGAGKDAKPVHLARVYTGVPKGKLYPYRSEKRGGVSSRGIAERALNEHNAKLAARNAQVPDPAQ
jgi:hypothetical protein